MQRRHLRFALAAAALTLATTTFILSLTYHLPPKSGKPGIFQLVFGAQSSSVSIHGANSGERQSSDNIVEVVELEKGRWRIVYSQLDPEAEGSYKPQGTWIDKITAAGQRVARPEERLHDELAPLYSDPLADYDDNEPGEDGESRLSREQLLGLEGHDGRGIQDHISNSKFTAMSRKERAVETLKILNSVNNNTNDNHHQMNQLLKLMVLKNKLTTPGSHGNQQSAMEHRSHVMEFKVKQYLSLPLPRYSRSVTAVLGSPWVKELQNRLLSWFPTRLATKPISVVTATMEHESVLLNWLISAQLVADPPLENVLVLTLSLEIEELLKDKEIPVLYVDPSTIINKLGESTIKSTFSRVHVVRLTLFRLINHWGVDAVMYDADAIVLKSPQPLFDEYSEVDLIGSAGRGPVSLLSDWERTVCTGVLLLRSTTDIEMFWEKLAGLVKTPFTDQGLVNLALDALQMEWKNGIGPQDDMKGETRTGRLKAVVLSEEKICRLSCREQKQEQYYAWHEAGEVGKSGRTAESKTERAMKSGVWFLKRDWELSIDSALVGAEWLLEISK